MPNVQQQPQQQQPQQQPQLQRNEAPLADVLKLKGPPPQCMSTKTYGKLKTKILPQLRARGDPPPRIMRAGTGDPDEWKADLHALLRAPGATLVRGFKLYKLFVDRGHWGEGAWFAKTHVVIATTTESGNVIYTDPTSHEDDPYIFVPSSRVHRDLTDEQLISGEWISGKVVGGHPRFCEAFVLNEQVNGRQRSVVAASPEELVAKRNVFVHFHPLFLAWYRERGHTDGLEILAEMMGCPIYNDGKEIDEEDVITAHNAMTENPEAYINGVTGYKLGLTCQHQLMRGEVSVDQVRATFFAHYDSSLILVRAAQAQRLAERLQARGFNTLYA